jgi:putative metalloprotease
MLYLTPILLAVLYGLVSYWFSTWRLHRHLDAQSVELADAGLRARAMDMAHALDLDHIKVFIHETPVINGLAAPDGRIFITRGFYDKYRLGEVTADELSSVIAHELGHVALGHSRRRMIDFSGQNAIRVVLVALLGRFVPVIGVWLTNSLSSLVAARLSRQDEYEADAYASALLIKSGIGTKGQKDLFRKLPKLAGHDGSHLPSWLLSHPHAKDRIAAIEVLERRWGAMP